MFQIPVSSQYFPPKPSKVHFPMPVPKIYPLMKKNLKIIPGANTYMASQIKYHNCITAIIVKNETPHGIYFPESFQGHTAPLRMYQSQELQLTTSTKASITLYRLQPRWRALILTSAEFCFLPRFSLLLSLSFFFFSIFVTQTLAVIM